MPYAPLHPAQCVTNLVFLPIFWRRFWYHRRMFDLKVENELPQMLSKLAGIEPTQWPKILASAANETGYYALNKYKQQMPSFFDRPTPFTLNSMFLQKATPSSLEAIVQWKDASGSNGSAGQYLQPEVFGGARPQKRFERALQAAGLMPAGYVCIPTKDAPIDSFGNVPSAFYQAILTYLKANPTTAKSKQIARLKRQGFLKLTRGVIDTALNYEKAQAKEQRAAQKKAKYFTAINGQGTTLPGGVYERVNLFGGAIRRLFAYVPLAQYKASFPFYQLGADAAYAKFPEKLDEAIAKSVANATAP